jgi:eukaryotic-like serine/threonine-protein kinase
MSHTSATLRQIVDRAGPLDYKRIARYAEELALQLAQLHQIGQLHNNVRPGNIFLNESGAAQLGPPEPSIKTEPNEESIAELVDYLAPERALSGQRIDARADIYCLGCTVYYLLTGQAASPDGPICERLLKHQSAKPQVIIQFRPDAPGQLVDICERMMAKKPSDRYQSTEEVARAIAAWRLDMDQPSWPLR